MSPEPNVTDPDTDEPMPESAEEPEPLPEGIEHLDTGEEVDDDLNATDDASLDIEPEQEREPEPEANADSIEPWDTDGPITNAKDHGAVGEGAARQIPTPLTDLRAEAKSRSLRSLAQGGVVAVLAQTVLVLYPLAQHLQTDTAFRVDWKAEGLIVAAAAFNALLAYIQKAMGR